MGRSKFEKVLSALISEARENGMTQCETHWKEISGDVEYLYEDLLKEKDDIETQFLSALFEKDHFSKGLDLCKAHILEFYAENNSLRQSLDSSMVHQEGLRGDVAELKTILENKKNPPQKTKRVKK